VWVNDGNRFEPDNPSLLSDLGLPSGLNGLDAAFVWGKNEKTYFFKNNLYWKYDDQVWDQGSISSTFYVHLLRSQIPNTQKKTVKSAVLFGAFGTYGRKSCK